MNMTKLSNEMCELWLDDLDAVAGGFVATEHGAKAGGIFEINDYSFDIEQTLNIGSQSSGARSGK